MSSILEVFNTHLEGIDIDDYFANQIIRYAVRFRSQGPQYLEFLAGYSLVFNLSVSRLLTEPPGSTTCWGLTRTTYAKTSLAWLSTTHRLTAWPPIRLI